MKTVRQFNERIIQSALVFTATCFMNTASAGLIVTEVNDGNTLASNIAGSGISISNISYSGASGASGTFVDGSTSGFGIDSGVILSTGSALNSMGPNSASNSTTNNGSAGYGPLDSLSGFTTFDATVLSFDFEFESGSSGDLFFNFVFGSEEYNEFVNLGFNDTFAFFLDGVNIATLPDDSPISIDTINNNDNAGLYNDNESGVFDTEMDGFTNSIQISALGLSAGQHTMEFAIADAGDPFLDSWILIETDSFSNSPDPAPPVVSVPEPGTLSLLLAGALGVTLQKRRLTS